MPMDPSTASHLTPSASAWTRWQAAEPALAGSTFVELRGVLLASATPPERKDDALAALVRLAQAAPADPQPKAALVALLLPGLRRAVRRYRDVPDAWAELLCGLLHHVAGYDLERRPRAVAANLILDATARLAREVRRERAWLDHIAAGQLADGEGPSSCDDGLAEAERAGVLAPLDATIIRATRLDGLDLADVALLFGLSYEAAKKRRRRAEVAWVAWWAPEQLGRAVR